MDYLQDVAIQIAKRDEGIRSAFQFAISLSSTTTQKADGRKRERATSWPQRYSRIFRPSLKNTSR